MAMTNTFVSTTQRIIPRESVLENVGENFRSHAPLCCLSADAVHRSFQFVDIDSANALIFLCGHDHSNIPILAADENRFALGSIEKRGKALFSISGGDSTHLSIIDKLDKIVDTLLRGLHA